MFNATFNKLSSGISWRSVLFAFLYIKKNSKIRCKAYGVERHFQKYFDYIVAVSFIGGGNRSTRRKPYHIIKWGKNSYRIIKYLAFIFIIGYTLEKDKGWMEEEGFDVKIIHTKGILRRLLAKFRSRMNTIKCDNSKTNGLHRRILTIYS